MREARTKLRLIKPEDMDMDEYLVKSLTVALLYLNWCVFIISTSVSLPLVPAMAWRLQHVQDSVCLPVDRSWTVSERKVRLSQEKHAELVHCC